MITKMTKYSFILLGGESENFLSRIQEIGLIDISRSRKPVDDSSAALFTEAESLRKKIEKIAKEDFTRDQEYNSLQKQLHAAKKEHALRLPWGEFSFDKIDELAALGFKLHFYSVDTKQFTDSWTELYPLEVISEDARKKYFVTVSSGDNYSFPVSEIEAPVGSCKESAEEIATLEKALEERTRFLLEEKNDIPSLEDRYRDLLGQLQRYLAKDAAVTAAENVIDTYVGFAPSESDAEVSKALDEIGEYYISEEATKDDNPPIKLKNNWFARNFETLTAMYGMPVYDEFDPTPILGPFFILFWSFCMGDSGYGLLLIAMGLIIKKVDILGLKNHWRLVVTLGVGATIIGFFLATFFGINLTQVELIPQTIRNCMIAGKIQVSGASYDVAMIAAIAVGVFHLCLALIVKATGLTKRFGIGKAVSVWGWIVLIVGGLCVTGLALTNIIDSSVTRVAVIIIGVVAGLSIYVFNTPGRNPLTNIGSGLWDTYNMATGLLGDVLSYIRLYALGLAGGMLGAAFNDLGSMVLGTDPTWQFIPFMLIVAFGHALNFAMACLGAFVHPLRLTFVEYFKNCGYEGRGIKYEPLKK